MLFSEMERTPASTGWALRSPVQSFMRTAFWFSTWARQPRLPNTSLQTQPQLSTDDTMLASGGFFGTKSTYALSQCLGGFPSGEEIRPHVVNLPLDVGTELLICSDGLHDMLDDNQIEACLASDPTESVQSLFEGAMHEGGVDKHFRHSRAGHAHELASEAPNPAPGSRSRALSYRSIVCRASLAQASTSRQIAAIANFGAEGAAANDSSNFASVRWLRPIYVAGTGGGRCASS